MLPDDVLLSIFDFCADQGQFFKPQIEAWQSLVHVCRRWRSLVFGSSSGLKLQLACSTYTPARDTLDVWPSLPLRIECALLRPTEETVDNIIAVLERRDRVCQIRLGDVPSSYLENVLAAMQEPFPELTALRFRVKGKGSVVPDSFLGGSAPRLQELLLNSFSFPGLPKLLLSATNLGTLHLSKIPHSGYISPEAMATALSTLTSLRELLLHFQSPRSYPDRASRRQPPPTPLVLPVLTTFWFTGVSEYLDDLVARADAPQLSILFITFFNQILFDTPQLIKFIRRTPMLRALEKAHVAFKAPKARVSFSSQAESRRPVLIVAILCTELDWQVSSLEQIITSCLPPLPMLEDLYIYKDIYYVLPNWQDNIENALWLELLQPFTAVKNLHLCEEFALRVAPALQELVGGRTTEVLPTLQNLFLEELQPPGPVQEGMVGKFISARQDTSYPITVRWGSLIRDKVPEIGTVSF